MPLQLFLLYFGTEGWFTGHRCGQPQDRPAAVAGHLSHPIERHKHLEYLLKKRIWIAELLSDRILLLCLEPAWCAWCLGEHSHRIRHLCCWARPAKAGDADDSLFASPTNYGGPDAVYVVSQSAGLFFLSITELCINSQQNYSLRLLVQLASPENHQKRKTSAR